ncbi:glycerophosphodiester phosphodiesterase [Paenibacillus camelliae]|uniref:glycerophosphodiester phosphodiesterase n=1 Tax=Paenibacillus camelliae TaxID=512410 RepID=UPI0020407322|nr:glycerophosphodiester phosphodiesterase [Paenibacillus camelliae]MCM3634660.1 glycerophosphodiester phosphodiesterase [Paenibacillus camelliae]
MTVNYAHRGASGYCPENTMAAFTYAVELGATGIETDVQMTADGELVLIHDESLLRTTGVNKLVKDVTLSELKALDAGSWYSDRFTGEKVPTLDELLELAKLHGLILNIEIKSGIVQYPGIERKILNSIEKHGLKQQCIISSFNHYALAACQAIDPKVATGILYMEGLYQPWNYAKTLGATALHAPKYAVNSEWVSEAKRNGVIYNVWTVNEVHEMEACLKAGVEGIITDYPDRLHQLLAKE